MHAPPRPPSSRSLRREQHGLGTAEAIIILGLFALVVAQGIAVLASGSNEASGREGAELAGVNHVVGAAGDPGGIPDGPGPLHLVEEELPPSDAEIRPAADVPDSNAEIPAAPHEAPGDETHLDTDALLLAGADDPDGPVAFVPLLGENDTDVDRAVDDDPPSTTVFLTAADTAQVPGAEIDPARIERALAGDRDIPPGDDDGATPTLEPPSFDVPPVAPDPAPRVDRYVTDSGTVIELVPGRMHGYHCVETPEPGGYACVAEPETDGFFDRLFTPSGAGLLAEAILYDPHASCVLFQGTTCTDPWESFQDSVREYLADPEAELIDGGFREPPLEYARGGINGLARLVAPLLVPEDLWARERAVAESHGGWLPYLGEAILRSPENTWNLAVALWNAPGEMLMTCIEGDAADCGEATLPTLIDVGIGSHGASLAVRTGVRNIDVPSIPARRVPDVQPPFFLGLASRNRYPLINSETGRQIGFVDGDTVLYRIEPRGAPTPMQPHASPYYEPGRIHFGGGDADTALFVADSREALEDLIRLRQEQGYFDSEDLVLRATTYDEIFASYPNARVLTDEKMEFGRGIEGARLIVVSGDEVTGPPRYHDFGDDFETGLETARDTHAIRVDADIVAAVDELEPGNTIVIPPDFDASGLVPFAARYPDVSIYRGVADDHLYVVRGDPPAETQALIDDGSVHRVLDRDWEMPRVVGEWTPGADAIARVPSGWGEPLPNRKSVGLRWQDPENQGNGIRIDQGHPTNPQVLQQGDHVIVRYRGSVIGPDGQPIQGSIRDNPQAHIPLHEWLTWESWHSPTGR